MKKDPAVYLHDILDAIDRIYDFTPTDVWDEKTRYAVERALMIIGEAGRRISDTTKEQAQDIAWNEINGLRNLLAHEYEHVNETVLKDIKNNHLAPLKKSIERLLGELKG